MPSLNTSSGLENGECNSRSPSLSLSELVTMSLLWSGKDAYVGVDMSMPAPVSSSDTVRRFASAF